MFNGEYVQRKIDSILEIENIEDMKNREELFNSDLFDKISKEVKTKRKKSFDRSRDDIDLNWLDKINKSDSSSSSSDNENEKEQNTTFFFEE